MIIKTVSLFFAMHLKKDLDEGLSIQEDLCLVAGFPRRESKDNQRVALSHGTFYVYTEEQIQPTWVNNDFLTYAWSTMTSVRNQLLETCFSACTPSRKHYWNASCGSNRTGWLPYSTPHQHLPYSLDCRSDLFRFDTRCLGRTPFSWQLYDGHGHRWVHDQPSRNARHRQHALGRWKRTDSSFLLQWWDPSCFRKSSFRVPKLIKIFHTQTL